MTAPAPLRGLRAAFVFLTRVPVGGFPYTDDEWRWAAAHFPLVGALLGVVVGAVDHVLLPLGELAAALGAIGASLFLAGALHEDGLADTSDALGGAFDRDKILAILKDSRVGTFGACALVLSIVGRAALLARLADFWTERGELMLAQLQPDLEALWQNMFDSDADPDDAPATVPITVYPLY